LKEAAEIETGMAGNSSWDLANRRQKLGLVWRIKKKISQIIKDYFYLPFFLLIILWERVYYLLMVINYLPLSPWIFSCKGMVKVHKREKFFVSNFEFFIIL
jgi:hypothetical protein